MEVIDLNEKVKFNEMFIPQIMRANGVYKTPLICMKEGQFIPPHASGTGVFYIVSGKGVMTVEGEEREVSAGSMIFVDKDQTRGIRATEELVAFAVHIQT